MWKRVPWAPTSGLWQNQMQDHSGTSAGPIIGEGFPLYLRERAGVRGNQTGDFPSTSWNSVKNQFS